MRKLSFRSQLILFALLLVLMPLSIIGFFSVTRSSRGLIGMGESNARQVAQDVSALMDLVFKIELNFSRTIASDPLFAQVTIAVNENGVDESIDLLNDADKALSKLYSTGGEQYESFNIIDANGLIIASSEPTKRDRKILLKDRAYFRDAMKGDPVIGDTVKSRSTGNPITVIAIPLKSESGSTVGVFSATLKLELLSDTVLAVKLGKTGYPYLIDQRGYVVIHRNKKLILDEATKNDKNVKTLHSHMLSGETGLENYVFKGIEKISAYAPITMTGWSVSVSQEKAEFTAIAKDIRNLILIVGLVFLVGAVLAVLWFVKRVMAQLGNEPAELAQIANRIADGDLTIQFNAEGNTGVYGSMARMTGQLAGMLGNIINGVQTLTTSSTELSAISGQMSENATQTSDRSNSVATAAEEMATNMNSVAAASEQTAANLQMIVAAAEEMSATISEIANNTSKGSVTTTDAVGKAEEISTRVNELGLAAAEISKVTETISEISDQTNLLALNATIEAARAGEAGKGFAVVAGEIKALAQQTAEATGEIGEKINHVQKTSEASVAAIREIVSIINNINEIVSSVAVAIEEQSATTQEISNNVSQAAVGVQEVNENVNQTSMVAGEVSKDIQMVSHAAEEINAGSVQVNESSGALSELAERLNGMVSTFRLG